MSTIPREAGPAYIRQPMGAVSDASGGQVARPWSGTWWLTSHWLRRRWLAVVPAALVLAVGTVGAALAFSTAQRTSSAYEDYLDRADVGDLVINASRNTREIDEAIRTLPGVEQVTSDALYFVSGDEGEPRRRDSVEEGTEFIAPRGSADGRYLDMDRPIVQSGRLPTGPNEAAVTVEMADRFGIAVGDVQPLSFWRALPDLVEGERFDALKSEVVPPLGVEHLTVVGIVTLPNEVLPDELYPRGTVIFSPDVTARYDCLPPTPPSQSSFDDFLDILFPDGCAIQYRYYSLSFTDGAAGVAPALEEFARRANLLNEQMANSLDLAEAGTDEPPLYFTVTIATQPELERIERAVRPTVTALVVLGVAAAAATLVLFGLAIARELRRTTGDQRQWRQLGMGVGPRAVVVSAPLAVAAVVGAITASAVTWIVGLGPAGVVHVIDPALSRRLDAAALVTIGGLLVLSLVLLALLALRSARRPEFAPMASPGWAARLFAPRAAPPAVAVGLRAAYGPRAAVPVVAAGILLTSALVAALVFGTSLSALISSSRSYGWPWDLAATTGGGYGDLELERAHTALDGNPDVASWTALGYTNGLSLDGQPMMTVMALDAVSDLDLSVLDGALPEAGDEVAIGSATAAERGLAIGDEVEIGGAIAPKHATISGIVVFPSLGPLLSERVGTGSGLLVPQALFEDAELVNDWGTPVDAASFVGVELRDDSDEARSRIKEELAGLDSFDVPVFEHPRPVRPPEIIDAGSTRSVPVAVGVVLATITAIGLFAASWASARSRRREIAVLRALGFDGAQVRRSVRVQSLATMLGALLVGVPVGVVVGRVLWRAFAEQLGVLPEPASAWLPVLLASGAALLVALLAAQVPAVLASRTPPAEGLRTE